jgi:hypothetical protein
MNSVRVSDSQCPRRGHFSETHAAQGDVPDNIVDSCTMMAADDRDGWSHTGARETLK